MNIQVIKTKENKDGSLSITFEIDEEFKDFIKKYYKKKRWSNKLGEKFLMEAVDKACQDMIPPGIYCHGKLDITERKGKPPIIRTPNLCPFWKIDKRRPEQRNGYCVYLGKGDWDFNLEAEIVQVNPKKGTKKIVSKKGEVPDLPWSLLWDQVKECGIKEEDDEDILD